MFAQGELLAFANQFPEAVLVEWIGPFLGAQRRTGSGAEVIISFEVAPRDQPYLIRAGYQVATDSNLTDGEAIGFVTTEELTIPPGGMGGTAKAIAINRGTRGNVGAGTITRDLNALAGVKSVVNLAQFGSAAENLALREPEDLPWWAAKPPTARCQLQRRSRSHYLPMSEPGQRQGWESVSDSWGMNPV